MLLKRVEVRLGTSRHDLASSAPRHGPLIKSAPAQPRTRPPPQCSVQAMCSPKLRRHGRYLLGRRIVDTPPLLHDPRSISEEKLACCGHRLSPPWLADFGWIEDMLEPLEVPSVTISIAGRVFGCRRQRASSPPVAGLKLNVTAQNEACPLRRPMRARVCLNLILPGTRRRPRSSSSMMKRWCGCSPSIC